VPLLSSLPDLLAELAPGRSGASGWPEVISGPSIITSFYATTHPV